MKGGIMSRKLFPVLILIIMAVSFASADDLVLTLTTDGAYYPYADPVPAASGNRFAKITGPYDGVEARTTFGAAYTIPVPFGDGPLVSGNTLVLKGTAELSPISIKPGISFSLTPIAFLVFSGGAEIASGWDIAGLIGAGAYNEATHSYDTVGTFKSCWMNAWFEGMFQFDLAAIIPGEWNHVVTQDSFRVSHTSLAGQPDDMPFLWQNSANKINGWSYLATFTLGYQMPLVLNTVAVQAEISGRFDDPLASQFAGYKSDYTMYAVNPVLIFKFGKNDSLATLFNFSTRRGYSTALDSATQSVMDLTTTGREWNFYRVAFSWTHTF